ncbi:MAG TPA: flagellar hook basal-body protein [Phycisphaerales bacterium]|nr:flagellar hook basal-body protein [Phycisphaerales bacterium]
MVNPAGQLGSSVDALVKEYETIAHNLANINTTGYKRRVNAFTRELMDKMADPKEVEQGEINVKGALDFTMGNLLKTGRPLDLAIGSKGFFVIETPDGPLYTRNGIFHLDNTTGQLIDINGRMVAGTDGPVIVPSGIGESQIGIAEDGHIMAGDTDIGNLRIVEFGEDEGKLVSVGYNCYMAPDGVEPTDAANALVRQGFQENSNVNLAQELIAMMKVSSLYDTNMKLLSRRREISKTIIGVANAT